MLLFLRLSLQHFSTPFSLSKPSHLLNILQIQSSCILKNGEAWKRLEGGRNFKKKFILTKKEKLHLFRNLSPEFGSFWAFCIIFILLWLTFPLLLPFSLKTFYVLLTFVFLILLPSFPISSLITFSYHWSVFVFWSILCESLWFVDWEPHVKK